MPGNTITQLLARIARWLGPLALALLVTACNPAADGIAPTATLVPATATAVPPTPTTAPADPAAALPADASPLHDIVQADLDGDGKDEHIVVAASGASAERLSAEAIEIFVLSEAEDGFTVDWRSGELSGERAEPLRVADVNGDGRPEVLSVQSMGAAGETLYVLTWRQNEYGFLTPKGGYFDGRASFGEHGARLEDRDGDGAAEIVANYGPAASLEEVYRWNGTAFVAANTVPPTTGNGDEMEGDLVIVASTIKAEYAQDQPVQFSIALQNESDTRRTLQFSSGQRFDISVMDAQGKEVWRWSREKFFTMALATIHLAPGERLSYEVDWDQKGNDGEPVPPGSYSARIWITANEQPATTLTFTIH